MGGLTPEDTDRLFAEYANAGDLDRLVSLYEADATLVFAPDQPARGTAAIRDALAGLLAQRPSFRMSIRKVVPAGDGVAVLYNDWTGTLGAEGARQEMRGRALEVVRRGADGLWRFIMDDPYARD